MVVSRRREIDIGRKGKSRHPLAVLTVAPGQAPRAALAVVRQADFSIYRVGKVEREASREVVFPDVIQCSTDRPGAFRVDVPPDFGVQVVVEYQVIPQVPQAEPLVVGHIVTGQQYPRCRISVQREKGERQYQRGGHVRDVQLGKTCHETFSGGHLHPARSDVVIRLLTRAVYPAAEFFIGGKIEVGSVVDVFPFLAHVPSCPVAFLLAGLYVADVAALGVVVVHHRIGIVLLVALGKDGFLGLYAVGVQDGTRIGNTVGVVQHDVSGFDLYIAVDDLCLVVEVSSLGRFVDVVKPFRLIIDTAHQDAVFLTGRAVGYHEGIGERIHCGGVARKEAGDFFRKGHLVACPGKAVGCPGRKSQYGQDSRIGGQQRHVSLCRGDVGVCGLGKKGKQQKKC